MKTKCTLLFLFWSLISFSQTEIKGFIKTKKGGPIIGATVMVIGGYDGAITDSLGWFSFSTSSKDSITLLVRSINYETKTLSFGLPFKHFPLEIQLEETFNELEVVTITAGAFEAGDKKKAVALTALDMVTTPGASGNVVNALQFLPGTSTNGESGKLFVRGGSSRESQTYIDGTLVHNPYNASAPNTAVRSRFNPFLFSGTTFSTGGFSAEFGQALSSVLLLNTKGLQEQDQLDLSVLSVGLGIAGTKKWETGAITTSIDYTNLSPYMAIIPQSIDWLKSPESVEAGLNFRQKTKTGLLKVYGNFSESSFKLNHFNLDSGSSVPLKLTNRNLYLNTSYKGSLNKHWFYQLSGAYTRYTENTFIDVNHFNETTNGGHAKLKLKRSISKKIKLNTGIELLSKTYQQSFHTPTDTFPNDFTNHTFGGFIEGDVFLSKKLVMRLGGRYEYATYLNRYNISPRLSMAYKLNKTSQFSLATGTFYQNPNQDHLIYSDQLNFEHTRQYMFNYTFEKNRRSIRAEVYYKDYRNLTKFNLDFPFYSPDHYTNNGQGHAYGFDFFFRDRKSIRNGDYWVSYSYLSTERNHLNFPNASTPNFASKHNISIVYKHWIKSWRTLFGASFNYASPRFFNDPNMDSFNTAQTKAYQSLNLNASYLFRENIIFYGSVTNVLGYQQEFGYQFANTPNAEGIYEKTKITPPAPRFYIIGCFITLSKTGDKNQLDKIN